MCGLLFLVFVITTLFGVKRVPFYSLGSNRLDFIILEINFSLLNGQSTILRTDISNHTQCSTNVSGMDGFRILVQLGKLKIF